MPKQTKIKKTVKFINPFTDFGFKKIFGEEPNKDLLIDFLNALLQEQGVVIKDLTYKRTDKLGLTKLDRNVVFDLYCENEKAEKFIVEMQKAKQIFFKDRTLFYSTFPIQEQAQKGGDWDFELKAVFAIAILDFSFDDAEKDKTIINRVQLLDTQKKTVFYDKLTYLFVQIPNFDKKIDELETHLDKWLFILKYLDKFERIPEKIKDKIFQKVFKIAEYHNLNESERQAYEDSLTYYRDLKNSLDTAKRDGYIEAEADLIPKILEAEKQKEQAEKQKEQAEKQKEQAEKQKEQAEKQKEQAEKQKKEVQIQMTKELKKLNYTNQQISEITKLSIQEIEKL
jgi:predicted transposase/invertase (TIGR01784 family)